MSYINRVGLLGFIIFSNEIINNVHTDLTFIALLILLTSCGMAFLIKE